MGKVKFKIISRIVLGLFTFSIVIVLFQNCAEQKFLQATTRTLASTGENGNPAPIKCNPDLPSPRTENYDIITALFCTYGGDRRKIDTYQSTLTCQDGNWNRTNDVIISTQILGSCNPAPAQNCGSINAGELAPPAYYGNNITASETCPNPNLSHQVTYQKLETYICDGNTGNLVPSNIAPTTGPKVSEVPCACLDQNNQIRQNAEGWAIGTGYEKSVIKKLYRCEAGLIYEQQSDCTALAPYNGSSNSATSVLQSCVDNAPAFMTLRLPPGEYLINNDITFTKQINVTTVGKTLSSAPCRLNDPTCAALKAHPDNTIEQGFIKGRTDDILLNSLIFDGNKDGRRDKPADIKCRSVGNMYGYNMTIYGFGNHIIKNSVFKNTLCGTGLAYNGSQLAFMSNLVADNGKHDLRFAWADGITLLISPYSVVADNLFVDNTDVQLIFGSCPNCEVRNNIIRHTGKFSSSSFAALLVHSWPGGTNGDYRSSYFHHNIIDCHASRRCGIGFGIGGNSWYIGPTYGGEYSYNNIKNAMVGININDATSPVPFFTVGDDPTPFKVKLRNNSVSDSSGPFVGSNKCRMPPYYCRANNYNISPNSLYWVDVDFLSNAS
ncbi:MAG: right-handed parallel beta-helix repeat-containing protein [Oligoflexia bacterium]|nr:right-handed parallel beta-helix repeat-containing protein [Oligoflexia bacterium]